MRRVSLWGYTIFENGKVVGLQDKEIKQGKQIKVKWGNTGKSISIKWGKQKKKRVVNYARFVYYAFNYKNFNFNDKTIVIKHKNGDEEDCSINNLTTINRKYINQGENNVSSKLTDKQVKEIKELYSKKKKVRMETNKKLEKNDPMTNVSYRKLAELYGVSHSMIAGIVKGQFRNKENYILK